MPPRCWGCSPDWVGVPVTTLFIDDSRAQRSVAEDVLHVSSVGDPVAAEDDDRDALTYSLEGVGRPIVRHRQRVGPIAHRAHELLRLCTLSCFCTPVLARYAGSELSDPERMPGQRPSSHELSGRIHGYSRPRHRPSLVDATLASRHSIWCRFINRSKDSMSFSHCTGYPTSSDRNRGALMILAPRCSPMGSRCRRSPVIR